MTLDLVDKPGHKSDFQDASRPVNCGAMQESSDIWSTSALKCFSSDFPPNTAHSGDKVLERRMELHCKMPSSWNFMPWFFIKCLHYPLISITFNPPRIKCYADFTSDKSTVRAIPSVIWFLTGKYLFEDGCSCLLILFRYTSLTRYYSNKLNSQNGSFEYLKWMEGDWPSKLSTTLLKIFFFRTTENRGSFGNGQVSLSSRVLSISCTSIESERRFFRKSV